MMMAKPDIQEVYMTSSGTLYRDDGKLGLESRGPVTGLNLTALDFANDVAAAAGGVAVGELYHTTGTVKVRRS